METPHVIVLLRAYENLIASGNWPRALVLMRQKRMELEGEWLDGEGRARAQTDGRSNAREHGVPVQGEG